MPKFKEGIDTNFANKLIKTIDDNEEVDNFSEESDTEVEVSNTLPTYCLSFGIF